MFVLNSFDNTRESRLYTFLIFFLVLGNVYLFPGIFKVGFGEGLLMVFMPFYFRKDLSFGLEKYTAGFVAYLFYLFLISLTMLNYFEAPISKFIAFLRVCFYWVVIFYFGKNLFNYSFFKKCMFVFSVSLSVFILIQFLAFKFIHFYIPGYITFLPLNRGGMNVADVLRDSLSLAGWRGFIRPSGFLLEPAHCAQTLFVCLVLFMNDETMPQKRKILLISLITIAMIVTYSTTGIVLLIFSGVFFLLFEKNFFYLRIGMIFLLFGCGFYLFFYGSNFDNWAVVRLFDILGGGDVDASTNMRLNNGLNLFGEFPFLFKFFGTGMGLFEYVSAKFGFDNAFEYMNTFSGILFSAGFIGMLIWLFAFVVFYNHSSRLGKCLIVGFLAMTMGCSVFCQPVMVWVFLIVLADIKKRGSCDRYSCLKL